MSYIDELTTALGKEKVLVDPAERFVYGADWSPRTPDEFVSPDVVILPRTTRDVQRTIKVAYEHDIPVTAGGGLTGMLGGAVPMFKGIYIDTTTMNSRRRDRPEEPDHQGPGRRDAPGGQRRRSSRTTSGCRTSLSPSGSAPSGPQSRATTTPHSASGTARY